MTSSASPFLSIVMPCHNSEATVGAALRSIPEDGRLEVVLIDDASTDGTSAVIEACAVERPGLAVKLLRNEVNMGPGGSRNRGISEARGVYLTFLDSDDEFSEGACDEIIASLADVGCDCLMFDALLERAAAWVPLKGFIAPDVRGGQVPAKDAFVYAQNATWGKVYLREKVVSGKVRFGEFLISEDTVFTKSALAIMEDVYYIAQPFYLYKECATSLTHLDGASLRVDRMGVYDRISDSVHSNLGAGALSDELNDLYYTQVVYTAILDLVKSGAPSGDIVSLYRELSPRYRRPDPYFDRLAPKFKIVYVLARLRLFGVLKVAAR